MTPQVKDVSILVVDDEKDLRRSICVYLKRKGFAVFEAENGRDAFDIVLSQEIDIVITDIRMAEGDGIELLEKLRKGNKSTPFVLMTTGFADIGASTAIGKGALVLINKPFDLNDLHEMIEQCLQQMKART